MVTRRNLNSTGERKSYGTDDSYNKWWDLSEKPKDNKDRVKKLGSFWQTLGAAVVEFDKFRNLPKWSDGAFVGKIKTNVPVDPDYMVIRQHKDDRDLVWAWRLPLDNANPGDKNTHRSVMFIDQCPTQHWAWGIDLLKIINIATPTGDKDLQFTPAGFNEGLGEGKGSKDRAALMLHIARNLGKYTDGVFFASLDHVIHISDINAGQPGATTTGCGGAQEKQGTLPGDVQWDFLGDLASIVLTEEVEETEGMIVTGTFWLGEAAPTPPLKSLAEDKLSNHPTIPRSFDKGLRVKVKIPRPGVPTPGPRVPIPTGAPVPTGESTNPSVPSTGQSNDVPSVDHKAGKTTGSMETGILTNDFLSKDLVYRVTFAVDTAPGVGELLQIHVGYSLKECGDDTNSLPTFITTTYRDVGAPGIPAIPSVDARECLDIIIPKADVKNSDEFELTIWRSRNDTYSGVMQLLNTSIGIGQPEC